jgi:dipeptidyl aminopeptidase/acylaminoacyl peptidase
VAAPDGTDPASLYSSQTENPVFLAWTPGGEYVSFLTQTDPFLTEGAVRIGLRTVPADGSGAETLMLEGYPLFFSWEPGGDRALVHTGGTGADNPDARISILTMDADFERDLPLEPAGFLNPAWSPDGTSLLMAIHDVQDRNALVVTSLQGQVRETITTFDKSIAFTWSPDSRYIGYIASDRERQGANGHLVIADPATGEMLFQTEEHLVNAFSWSPDGRQLVYFTQELVSDESGENLFYGIGFHFLDTENWEVRHPQFGDYPFIFQPTPHFRQYLLAFDQFQQGATIWSPDGEYVVLSALSGNEGVILIVTVSGNREPRQLDTGLMAFWSGG